MKIHFQKEKEGVKFTSEASLLIILMGYIQPLVLSHIPLRYTSF